MTTSRSRRNAAPAPELPVPAAVDLQATIDAHAAESQAQLTQLIEQQHAAIAPSEPVEAAPVAPAGRKLPDAYFSEGEVNTLLEHINDTTIATRLASAWRLALPLNAAEYSELVAAFNICCNKHLELTDYKAAVASGRLLGSLATKLRLTYGIDNLGARL